MPKKTELKSKQQRLSTPKPQKSKLQTGHLMPSRLPCRPNISLRWFEDLRLLTGFRHRTGKWPSRDSTDPTETSLANWLRSNLELHWALQLPAKQMQIIDKLLEGSNDKKPG